MKRCIRCRCDFTPEQHAADSHSLYCKDCREVMKQKKQSYINDYTKSTKSLLGTTDFEPHMIKDNFSAEHQAIISEMKKLGVYKNGRSKTAKKERV